ncbi:retrovirus-related pol polyprotein from transposon TNT 1-94 [Tanacetum coccineum]
MICKKIPCQRLYPRLKFVKDHLCSAMSIRKSKKHTHKPKTENTNLEVLNTLHMDLCGPMRVQTINGKKYILVIVDDYSRFTWVKFLRSKDETHGFVIKYLKQIQTDLNKKCQGLHSRTALSKDEPNSCRGSSDNANLLKGTDDPIPNVVQDPVIPTGPSMSISIDLDAPSGSHISSPLDHHSSSVHHGVAGKQYAKVNPFAAADPEPFVNVFRPNLTL